MTNRTVKPMTGRRLRLGMVGGGQGSFFGPVHRTAARLDDQFDLVAGRFSTNADNNRATGTALYLASDRIYTDFTAMARAEAARPDGIDAVSIVTPNYLHYQAAKIFLEHGIHVICDKPMTTTEDDATSLVHLVEQSGLCFTLTHTYAGYAMVRAARHLVQSGAIGTIRLVQVEYPQGWLAHSVENGQSKQAAWRLDPSKAGPSACLGDIGTHAYHLVRFISGLEVTELSADLQSFGPGRVLEDNAHIMLRFKGGARGLLWSSQVALGHQNDLRIRIYGEQGSILWSHTAPEKLTVIGPDGASSIMEKGDQTLPSEIQSLYRLPSGHPEGYFEALGQLYKDTATVIRDNNAKRLCHDAPGIIPDVLDGLEGIRFIATALESARHDSRWTALPPRGV